MLDGVKPEAVGADRIEIPFSPALQLFLRALVLHVEIGAHQEIEVAVLRIHRLVPVLAGEAEYRLVARPRVAVHSAELIPVP